MIIFRTTSLDCELRRVLDDLAEASDEAVAIAADERSGVFDTEPYPKFAVDEDACRSLGLHTPPDFAWRCGDYCCYVAADRLPHEEWFWLIDFDVRIACAREFFSLARQHPDVDLLAGYLGPAAADWSWRPHASARDAVPWRCFFPLVRLSRRAALLLLEKRQSHSRQATRRRAWPNDEAFVATTLAASGLKMLDFNEMSEEPVYDAQTYSFRNVIPSSRYCPSANGPRLYHPLLNDAAAGKKEERSAHPHERRTNNILLPWRLCRLLNRMKAW